QNARCVRIGYGFRPSLHAARGVREPARGAVRPSARGVPNMAEQPQPNQPQGQQIQLRIDESKMHSTYANTIRSSSTLDEVILDFGLNIPQQGAQGQPPVVVFSVGSRIIMNWAGAKRLAMTL